MPSAVEVAVDTFTRAWSEPDAALREKMIEECFAEDGRMVMRTREVRGRAALAAEMAKVQADPQLLRIRLVSVVDARGNTFRYRAVADRRDGSSPETFDAGEIDASGRICLVLTFTGVLQSV
ncbi:MAG: nuclear transport factor 2 family protein [Polyangiaceae bacterium]